MILKKYKHVSLPVKWFTIGQCWRYETLSKGRFREHYQWNVDIAGIPDIRAEFELIHVIISFLKSVGLSSSDIVIRINSKKLLEEIIGQAQFDEICVIVDKLDKLKEGDVKELLKEFCDEERIKNILECSKQTFDYFLKYESSKELIDLFGLLEDVKDWISFDFSIVRGLSYYTGIVFEVCDRSRKFRSIAGGGRYDNLISTYSNSQNSLPMCGFGFGDCVIFELLKSKGLLPSKNIVDYYVAFLDDSLFVASHKISSKLREKYIVELSLKKRSFVAYAKKINAKFIILVGEKEWKEEKVILKSMDEKLDNEIISLQECYEI